MWDVLQAGRGGGAGWQPPATGSAGFSHSVLNPEPFLAQHSDLGASGPLTPCSGLFSRHPVRHVWFNSHSLITANIPEEKNPRGSSITDDDPSLHRK